MKKKTNRMQCNVLCNKLILCDMYLYYIYLRKIDFQDMKEITIMFPSFFHNFGRSSSTFVAQAFLKKVPIDFYDAKTERLFCFPIE